jgi:alpha-glucuronidase
MTSPVFSLSWMPGDAFIIDRLTVGEREVLAIASFTDAGVLYGVFDLLRRLQTGRSLVGVAVGSGPRIGLRMLDHWDNLDGSIERGYAGRSLWRWDDLPETGIVLDLCVFL